MSNTRSIYSQGFLLAEPNRKWEGEGALWYSSHPSALGYTAGRGRWKTDVEGQMAGPLYSHHELLHH